MAFLKEVEVTLTVYYGVTVSTGDVCMALRSGTPKTEEKALEHLRAGGLDFNRVDNAARGAEFAVGKRLATVPSFVRLNLTDDLRLPRADKLSQGEELDVVRRLYAAGLVRTPGYFVAQYYRTNDLGKLRR